MVFIWCAIYYSLPGNIHWRINLMPLYDGRKGRNAMKSCSIIGFVRWFLSRPLDNHFNDTQHYKTNSLELRAWDYLQKCKYMLWFNRISRRQSPLSREGDAERESACCANKLNTLPEYRRKSNTNTHSHTQTVHLFFESMFPFFLHIFTLQHRYGRWIVLFFFSPDSVHSRGHLFLKLSVSNIYYTWETAMLRKNNNQAIKFKN